MDATAIELLILDVDGVLTDGRLFPAPQPSEVPELSGKAFHVQDGHAIKLWQRCGYQTAILSGRDSPYVTSRARELGIGWCRTGADDKLSAYVQLIESAAYIDAAVAYVGDDLPDLRPMARCGFPVAVANAVPAVKQAAAYVTRRAGGSGAVAEVVELLLRRQKRWSRALVMET